MPYQAPTDFITRLDNGKMASLGQRRQPKPVILPGINGEVYSFSEKLLGADHPDKPIIAVVLEPNRLDTATIRHLASCCDDIAQRFTPGGKQYSLWHGIFTGLEDQKGVVLLRVEHPLPPHPENAMLEVCDYINEVLAHKRLSESTRSSSNRSSRYRGR